MKSHKEVLRDKLIKLGRKLVDEGYAEVPGDYRVDEDRNIEHLIDHQLEYINIWYSEEKGFYLDSQNYSALGIFTYFPYEPKDGTGSCKINPINEEKKKHNEDSLMHEINEHINYLTEFRKQIINIVCKHINDMNMKDITPYILILPEAFVQFLGPYLFGTKVEFKNLPGDIAVLLAQPYYGKYVMFTLPNFDIL